MVKTLIKKQLLELFQSYFIDKKTGKARSLKGTVGFMLLLVFLFLSLGFAFYSMAGGLGGAILGHDINWLYFALMGLLAMAFGVFGSVFNTYASLYLPKDNEFLLSLPIPPRKLLLARLMGVYVTGFMYSAWIWIPVMIAYWVQVPITLLNVIFPVMLTFIIALFVAVLSCILGFLVAIVATKTKNKSFLTVFFSLAVIVLYYVVYFKIIGSIGEIIAHLDAIGDKIKTWLYYIYLLGNAADGKALSFILFTAITAAVSLLCFFILTKTFLNLAKIKDSSEKKIKGKTEYSRRSAQTALLMREYKHFTSIPTWMLNGGLGLLLMPVGAIVLIIKSKDIGALLPVLTAAAPSIISAIPIILTAAVCIIISANCILPVSVSIEGKSLWILQSLPVKTFDILRAKLKMAVQMSIYPALFLAIVAAVVFKLSLLNIVLVCCAVWIFNWVFAEFGLFLNLKSPNFSWTNVATLTKQSMPVMISLFGGWAFCAAVGVGGFFLCRYFSAPIVLAMFIALFLILWFVLHRWLKTTGTKIFAAL